MNHTLIVNNWRGFLVEDLLEQDYFDSSSINEELLNEIGADTFRDVAQYILNLEQLYLTLKQYRGLSPKYLKLVRD